MVLEKAQCFTLKTLCLLRCKAWSTEISSAVCTSALCSPTYFVAGNLLSLEGGTCMGKMQNTGGMKHLNVKTTLLVAKNSSERGYLDIF